MGRKHEPSFRLVLTRSENSTKSGRFTEILGSYDPRKDNAAFKADRIKHWFSMGVAATPTAQNLLIKKGIIKGKKVNVSKAKAKTVESATIESVPEAVS